MFGQLITVSLARTAKKVNKEEKTKVSARDYGENEGEKPIDDQTPRRKFHLTGFVHAFVPATEKRACLFYLNTTHSYPVKSSVPLIVLFCVGLFYDCVGGFLPLSVT